MKNLEWCELCNKFYAFKLEADKYGFYTPETDDMEDSLYKMRPFKQCDDIDQSLKELSSEDQNIEITDMRISPTYEDDDKLYCVC